MDLKSLRHIFFTMGWLLLSYKGMAQNAPITEPQLMYTQSSMFGVGANSFKSFGMFYRYGWHETGTRQNHLEFDFSRIKHPKEVRRQGYTESQSQYTFGRLNVVFFLRSSYGQTVVITDRPYKNALGLNFVYSIGVSTAFLKPVYIDVYHPYDNDPTQGYLVSERYDPAVHTDIYSIYGNSGFTKGLSDTQLKLGGFGRAGFQVEWGQYADEIKCLEAGVTLDAFASGIPIMAHQPADKLLYGFYLNYNWGSRK